MTPSRSDVSGDPTSPIVLRAHAKLTLSLRMTGLRDDGFHLIDAEMVSLDLHDVVRIEPDGAGLTVTGPYGEGVPTDSTNLVATVLAHWGGGRTIADVGIAIDKHIPHGGGLGGGSTDAAAVARWLRPDLDPATPSGAQQLIELSEIGADIAFCAVGGRARVRGIGEVVEPLPHVDRTLTLVIPPLSVSTPAAYRAWDDLGGPTGPGPNDLEPAALVVEPRLAWWRGAITERCGEAPVLAGSGATWFVHGERANALADLVDEGAEIVVATTVAEPGR
ncbi:MAG: 4-(cytidine 5'-diphospho)-2-C-methyl-D-erythritol kinase [Actinomycetota bacterium]